MSLWNKELELFQKDCANAIAISRQNLKKLMEDNQHTEYGKKYGFSEIRDAETFQKKVPISDYADYGDAIERMRAGEQGLITAYDVKHYIMTSGSTGLQKKIPLTKEALARCIRPIYYASYAGVEGIEEGQYLHMSVFRMEPPLPERETILSAAYFRELLDRGDFGLEERYLGGKELLFTKGIGLVPYVKGWIALSSPQMAGIQAFFLYDILLFLRWFEEHWKELLTHLESRCIPEELPLSASVREAMLQLPVPDKSWLQQVRRECEAGMDGIVKRLWKNMKFVSGVGGSTFFAQEAFLRGYLGDIPLHYFSYAASECMMAIVTEKESDRNVLMPNSGFFEFIPYREETTEEEPRPRCIWELEEGKLYEILITNFSGLYRYRLNDVVKVAGFYGEAPVLEICFRKNQVVNVAGEKMDMQTIAAAMEKLADKFGFQVYEYSVCDDKTKLPGQYLCFFEGVPEEGSCIETGAEMDKAMDELLKSIHEDYKDVRQLGMLDAPRVYRVEQGTHAECKKLYGAGQAQNKPLQYLSNTDIINYMREKVV